MHGLRVSFNLSRVGPHRQPHLQPSSWFIAQSVTIAEIFSRSRYVIIVFT
ncbi:hypothetical protein BFJ69_g14697 [Fusarium oxysporum]|uniref:Uncharacterized protein n=1 Tax=Fusarium oxysporum TaxID=5507 RepID=A0A420MGQ3_FUSOX|nr:hypothetical protein BFJ69_g14697 [Fusarium oxysporum]